MGWASEQFWRDLASVGIYPNVPDEEKKPGIEPGKVYLNRNGKCYLCKSVDGGKSYDGADNGSLDIGCARDQALRGRDY